MSAEGAAAGAVTSRTNRTVLVALSAMSQFPSGEAGDGDCAATGGPPPARITAVRTDPRRGKAIMLVALAPR